jgi:P4 family phage/plasmid primase-like protien
MALEGFLKKFYSKDAKDHTHTRIGSPKLNLMGGSYTIPASDIDEFYKIYTKYVFEERKQSYLTEKQLDEGPILIDVDFRYDTEVEERQHTKEHIVDFIQLVLENLNKIVENNNKMVSCYVFEKEHVNMQEKMTKDGIHFMIHVRMDYVMKYMLRNLILKEIADLWSDIPIINTWADVLDEKVMEGYANWQLFGSRKPGNEDYKLSCMFHCVYSDGDGGTWDIKEEKIKPQWILENFKQFTCRDSTLVIMPLKDDMKEEYETIVEERKRRKKGVVKNKVKLLTNISSTIQPYQIASQEQLDDYIEDFMSNLSATDYLVKEAHAYVMILPVEYWGPGSYAKWIRVGWALKNTDPRLFITWLKFSSQSTHFDYSQVPELFDKWTNFDTYNNEGLTLRSIMYWCKTSNEKEFGEIRGKTIYYYIYYSINHNTEFDLAMVLYQMYKDSFICVSIKDSVWYEFINNRWKEIDDGYSIRAKISTEMYNIYYKLTKEKENEALLKAPTKEESNSEGKEQVLKFMKTSALLKKTSSKNNIMKESKEIFYDKDFYSKLNTNNYLIGCNNCIIDFKNKMHRKGKHDDYISKTTGLDYYTMAHYEKTKPEVIEEINTFMSQLFPEEELKVYMWEHLASTLLGNNENQTFNIYIGTGANGKSKLIDLMGKVLGEYKGTVPITLITQKRNSIGSTSSEIHQLIGVRYAVMQEPSNGDKINEGIMKEITGGDPIQCRALFKESVTFIPQFKLAVATNCFPEMTATDDGTWRRVRAVEYKSKFTKNPYHDPQFPKEDYPYQFAIDTKIDEKFDIWAPVMFSMLVEIAYKTQGKVKDCDAVMKKSEEYRKEQDVFLEFTSNCIQTSVSGEKLKISIVKDCFKNWYSSNYGNNKNPPFKQLLDYMAKKYGRTSDGWNNIEIVEVH